MTNMVKKKERLADFYEGKTVLITGATGFMGKVLLEKLLYSCPGVEKVFILVRPKKGKLPSKRVEEMFSLPMFERLRTERPQSLKKVIAIEGDITLESLGLPRSQLEFVRRDVSIVFHCAATLKLESNLTDAVHMNTWGTARILELAKTMTHLKRGKATVPRLEEFQRDKIRDEVTSRLPDFPRTEK